MTFAWQMKQPIGVPNPNAFTAYFLPRYVSGYLWNQILLALTRTGHTRIPR